MAKISVLVGLGCGKDDTSNFFAFCKPVTLAMSPGSRGLLLMIKIWFFLIDERREVAIMFVQKK